MMDFLFAFSQVVSDLSALLGMEFLPDSRDNESAIGLALQSIFNYHNRGDVLSRGILLNRMALLAKNLREIHDFDLSLLGHFEKIIRKSRNIDGFFGTRFEINIAATLIRHETPFEKTESPDFTIRHESGKIGIECTSARMRKDKDTSDLLYKVEAAIRSKSSKDYSDLRAALFLDVTNLVYRTLKAGASLYTLLDREKLPDIVNRFRFGNLTLFTYLPDISRGGIQSAYTRVDHLRIQQHLASLLDVCFPFGSVPLDRFAVPEEG
jgi:hypothetical protein